MRLNRTLSLNGRVIGVSKWYANSMTTSGCSLSCLMVAAILRWSSDSDMKRKQAEIFGGPADYGLLSVVAVVETPAEAQAMQIRLSDAGIRATVSPSGDRRMNVLVFDAERDAARRLVGGSQI